MGTGSVVSVNLISDEVGVTRELCTLEHFILSSCLIVIQESKCLFHFYSFRTKRTITLIRFDLLLRLGV